MLGVTHFAGGAAVGAIGGLAFGNPLLGMAIGAFGGLIPDIDEPGSLIGRKLPILAWPIKLLFGHRTITHTVEFSMFVTVLMGAIFYAFIPAYVPMIILCLFIGQLSHLMLDCCTLSGVKPILLCQKVHIHGPVRTGSFFVETPVALFLVGAALKISGII